MVEKVKTYIKGLDECLYGGIPEKSVILVGGKPGSMKSSFVFNILYHNAKEGIPCAYITLEQSKESLLEHMTQLGMDVKGLEFKFSIVDLGMIRKKLSQMVKQTWMEVFRMYVDNLKENMNIRMLAIDSMQVLEFIAGFKQPRDDFFKLLEWLRALGFTTFLLGEMDQDSEKFCQHGESFLADGIIHLDMRRKDRNVNLFISIVKMRKTNHRRGYFPLIFDKNGFEIVLTA
jgi:KaiC/GvpD/RAD55 family RecA-like ATPase